MAVKATFSLKDLFNQDFDLPLGLRLLICIVVFTAMSIPVMLAEHLSFVDYPNHLARFYIWQNLDTSQQLSTYYERHHGMHPYWAMRLFINGLSPIVGLEMAGRIFITIATLMPAAGACCVGWVTANRITLLPLGALALSYNYLAAWGFHNFLFAGGIALMACALWIAMRTSRSWQRVLVIGALAGAISMMHLLAAAILVLLIFAFSAAAVLTQASAGKRTNLVFRYGLELIAITLLPALFYLSLDAGSLGDNTTTDGGIILRFVSLMSPFVMFGTDTDMLLSAAPMVLVAAAVGAGIFKFSRQSAIVLIILLMATLVAPYKLFGVAINWRIPVFAGVLFFALTDARTTQLATRNGIALAVAVLLLLRIGDVSYQLHRNSNELAELQAAGKHIHKGSRVLPIYGNLPKNYLLIYGQDRLAHYTAALIPTRQIFYPLLFPFYDVAFREPYSKIATAGTWPVTGHDLAQSAAHFEKPTNHSIAYAKNWHSDYDYLLVYGTLEDDTTLQHTKKIHQGSFFRIYQITAAN